MSDTSVRPDASAKLRVAERPVPVKLNAFPILVTLLTLIVIPAVYALVKGVGLERAPSTAMAPAR